MKIFFKKIQHMDKDKWKTYGFSFSISRNVDWRQQWRNKKIFKKWFWYNVVWTQWIKRHNKYWDPKRKIDRREEYNRNFPNRTPL